MITEIKHPNNTEAFKTHTVYGRFNKIVEPLTEFDISKYENALFGAQQFFSSSFLFLFSF